LHRNVNQLER